MRKEETFSLPENYYKYGVFYVQTAIFGPPVRLRGTVESTLPVSIYIMDSRQMRILLNENRIETYLCTNPPQEHHNIDIQIRSSGLWYLVVTNYNMAPTGVHYELEW